MSNRREFLKDAAGAAAGIMFCGCNLLGPRRAAAQETKKTAAGPRRQVMVGGRRVKTIDVHAHCTIPEANALLAGRPGAGGAGPNSLVMGPERLRMMDEQGIDMEALSINPTWYAADRDLAAKVIKIQNEKLAELCAKQPDRFVAFATVALQHPDLAAQQLEEGMKKLGLRGGSIGASVNGEELSARRFDPFWAKAEELGALLFMHPQGAPELDKRLKGNGMLTNVIGNPLDTTIALSRMIFDGTLDRFPRLKICGAHGGGYLPAYADRFDHGCVTFPANCDKTMPKKHPTEYLRQLYFDSLIFTPEALRHLIAECGVSQIMMGTDYPFPWTSTSVDHVLGTAGLSNAEKTAILGGNASKLLGIAS
jgi:predicted TIM-barrel fold metal-dependent hydrolase